MRQNHESHKMTMQVIAEYNGNRPRRWRLIWKELSTEAYRSESTQLCLRKQEQKRPLG